MHFGHLQHLWPIIQLSCEVNMCNCVKREIGRVFHLFFSMRYYCLTSVFEMHHQSISVYCKFTFIGFNHAKTAELWV